MPDYGMLSGLAKGLQAGFESYRDTKKAQREQDALKVQQQLLAAKEGYTVGEDGSVAPTTATLGKQQFENQQYDKNDPYAELSRQNLRQQVRAANPNLSNSELEKAAPAGLSAKAYNEQMGLLKPQISGQYGLLRGEAIAEGMKGRNQIMGGNLDARKADQASHVEKEIRQDKIIAAADSQSAAINKGTTILNSGKPVTPQMLSDLEIDLANAISGGRSAAQGTIHRVEMDTLERKLANAKQYISGVPREGATPEQKAYLQGMFEELRGINSKIKSDRVGTISKTKLKAYQNNPYVKDVLDSVASEDAPEEKSAGGLINAAPPAGGKAPSREEMLKALRGG